jgi:SAM-dependent methyltransferase
MADRDSWASVAAALPQADRAARESQFWRSLATAWGWRAVLDAGCGAGFHVRLLRTLSVQAVGFDLAPAALLAAPRGLVLASDLLLPAVRPHAFDAVVCLGNTISLLAHRHAQGRALRMLASALRPGGILLLQGEDAGALVDAAPQARLRALGDGSSHLRVFHRRGRRVEMLAGVARPGEDTALVINWLLPTSPARLHPLARQSGLTAVDLPAPPPAGPPCSWWLALRAPTT